MDPDLTPLPVVWVLGTVVLILGIITLLYGVRFIAWRRRMIDSWPRWLSMVATLGLPAGPNLYNVLAAKLNGMMLICMGVIVLWVAATRR